MSFLGRFFGPPDVGRLKDRRDVEGLIKALWYEDDAKVRRTAAKALGDIRDPRAVPQLIKALQDDDKWVRHNAVVAMGKIRDDRAVEPLIAILRDGLLLVQEQAVWSLGNIGDPRALGPVVSFRKQQSVTDVRDRAAKIIAKLTRAATRCTFCGRELHAGSGMRRISGGDDPLAAMQQAAQQMLARKVVCSPCGAVFCLECGNAVGVERGTGKTHCPECGKAVPSSQLM